MARVEVLLPLLLGAQALDNGFTTPPMGWSALYGAPFGRVSQDIVLGAAKGLVTGGFEKFGYKYITIDDWYTERLPNGTILGDPKVFPSGIPAVSESIHNLGLKFGVYSSASQRTCGNRSASEWREAQDADTFAHVWKIDMLKYDSCLYNGGVSPRARYTAMSRALNSTGRPIRYSVEGWSPSEPGATWAAEVANTWRTGADMWPHWDHPSNCVLRNLYQTNIAAPFMRPGSAFNDPDMLQPPGNIPGSVLQPGLTFDEAQSQFVLWAVMKAPLILGLHWDELATLQAKYPEYFSVITNTELIEINQDLSRQATLVCQKPSAQQERPGSAVEVTMQLCDPKRCDQKWVVSSSGHGIHNADGKLCLTEQADGTVNALPCDGGAESSWSLRRDSQLSIGVSSKSGDCLDSSLGSSLQTKPCTYQGPLPPPLNQTLAHQVFLWDAQEGQLVAGGDDFCATLGRTNLPTSGNYVSNNGTLNHEVWKGGLSNGKQVVVLLNKGATSETLSASARVLEVSASKPVQVRDLLAKKDLPPLAPGAALSSVVPSHGVRAFVIGQYSRADVLV